MSITCHQEIFSFSMGENGEQMWILPQVLEKPHISLFSLSDGPQLFSIESLDSPDFHFGQWQRIRKGS